MICSSCSTTSSVFTRSRKMCITLTTQPIRRASLQLIVERFGLKTSAVALWTIGVSAVAAEQNAHVHFVNLRFEPTEEAADAVPTIVFVIVGRVFTTSFFAVDDKVLIGLGQFLERNIDVYLFAGAGPEQIFLRFTKFVPTKNADDPLFDR